MPTITRTDPIHLFTPDHDSPYTREQFATHVDPSTGELTGGPVPIVLRQHGEAANSTPLGRGTTTLRLEDNEIVGDTRWDAAVEAIMRDTPHASANVVWGADGRPTEVVVVLNDPAAVPEMEGEDDDEDEDQDDDGDDDTESEDEDAIEEVDDDVGDPVESDGEADVAEIDTDSNPNLDAVARPTLRSKLAALFRPKSRLSTLEPLNPTTSSDQDSLIMPSPTSASTKLRDEMDRLLDECDGDEETLILRLIKTSRIQAGKLRAAEDAVPDGHVVVSQADADLLGRYRELSSDPEAVKAALDFQRTNEPELKTYREFGKPDEVRGRLDDGKTARESIAKAERENALKVVAAKRGYNPDTFSKYAAQPGMEFVPAKHKDRMNREYDSFDVKTLDADGKEVVRPIEEVETSDWADLGPSLRSHAANPTPSQLGGQNPGTLFPNARHLPPPAPGGALAANGEAQRAVFDARVRQAALI